MKTNLVILLIVVVLIVIGGGAYLYTQKPITPEEGNKIGNGNEEPVACQADAMQCPDGSYVSRTGVNCEFAECPETSCIKEGKQVNDDESPASKSCCAGLVKVEAVDEFSEGAVCKTPGAFPSYEPFRCVACGNNECGLGENKCNCPADCTE